jgi:hypothetical protein
MGLSEDQDNRDRHHRGDDTDMRKPSTAIQSDSASVSRLAARRGSTLVLAWLLAAIAALLLTSASASAQQACPNEELRAGSGTMLPDCRAFEMVSPAEKEGYYVTTGHDINLPNVWASVTGNAVVYQANGAFPGSVASGVESFYLASRGPAGWSNRPLVPPQAYSYANEYVAPYYLAFSPDLSDGILLDATDSPALVSGEQETVGRRAANLFVRDDTTDSYSLVNAPASGVEPLPYKPIFDGASADLSTVLFNAKAALTPEALTDSVENLYESVGGVVGLVNLVPPAGQTSCGPVGPACVAVPQARFGVEDATLKEEGSGNKFARAVSSDGSRIVFNAGGKLYLRVDDERTVQLDVPQGAGPGGGGVLASLAADGSRVFFTDEDSAGLTADTGSGSGESLYSYETATETLTDLTPGAQSGLLGVVGEASEDGSYIYFVATGVLTSVQNSLGQEAQAGAENLYVSDNGAISFVHTVVDPSGDLVDSRQSYLDYHGAARVTPDGRHLAFFAEDISGNDVGYGELFEYSADAGRVERICSCGASGFMQFLGNSVSFEQMAGAFRYTNFLSDDGSRVFFESSTALVPRDTDGQSNVYEFEQDGAGSCHVASGCLYLISTGTSVAGSYFGDASPSGDDVFFTTSQQLSASDTDGEYDLYDARVEGGFPSPPSPAPCLGDACQPPPQILNDPTPASFTFSGTGNVQSAQPAVKQAVKQAKKKAKPKPRKRKGNGKAKSSKAGKSSNLHRKGGK